MRKEVQIPETFELIGRKISVVFQDDLIMEDDKVGLANYRIDKVVLQPTNAGVKRPIDRIKETYFHEVTHFILEAMESKLFDDETFVSLFSSLLYQVLKTSEYKEEK